MKRSPDETKPCPWPLSRLCEHQHVKPETVDQTLGVACTDCHRLLAWCWADHHVPESLWNRACKWEAPTGTAAGAVPCEQDRDDFCAVCDERIGGIVHHEEGRAC